MHVSKRMMVAYATRPSTSVMTASFALRHQISAETSKSLDHSAVRKKHSTNCDAEDNTALSEVLQARHENDHNLVNDMHYKSRTDSVSQLSEVIRRRQDASAQSKRNRSKVVAISANYYAHKNHVSTCCRTSNPCAMATFARSTLQSTASSCQSRTQHEYTPLHPREALRLKDLRKLRSIKCSRKT